MTLIDDTVAQLLTARRLATPSPAPTLPDAATAYAVHDGVAAALGWFADGTPQYWKSGGPARDRALMHAALPPAGVWTSPADARAHPFRLRGIEAEIALRLAAPVDAARAATLDHDSARALIDAMSVSIELVDSRWSEALEAPAFARLADLLSHGALVLGDWVPFQARDWDAQRCTVRIGAQPLRAFRGSHPLRDPAFVLPAWLRHATRDGATLAAGTVVTTGTWCGIPLAEAGDEVEVAFEGIGAARVRL